MPDGMKDEGNKKVKCYTWRHRWTLDSEYSVLARSMSEARKIAIERHQSEDAPDRSMVVRDTWTLMEVEDD